MQTITGVNVNEVYPIGLVFLRENGVLQKSQHGLTIEIPGPVSVCYLNPRERCQFDPVRDSNPFLNLFEALWILQGREDVKFLADIVGRMATYADDGETFYGAYGARLRGTSSFLDVSTQERVSAKIDQIEYAIDRLKANPADRQVVLTIRQPSDMAYKGKDQPCNLMASLKVRNGKLNIHVFNRSNDFIWGMTGTNVVQFSMLQEYIAGKLGVEMGTYHQTTDSMHVYVNKQYDHIRQNTTGLPRYDYYSQDITQPYHMFAGVADLGDFDHDLNLFFQQYDKNTGMGISRLNYRTGYFADLVFPAWYCFQAYKNFRDTKREASLAEARRIAQDIPADWCVAIREWLDRRGAK